ncbi:MAG TPA: pilus assembly protein N-terminal domain-containing protein [Candidatus Acidoferrales bacterium]|nr:pilus assembly protein N-terminal domain-containing protein [Candidatus Acidoferrales bacterium]
MRLILAGALVSTLLSGAVKAAAQPVASEPKAEDAVLVRAIAVSVNKSVVIRLPKKAARVAVTRPEIAEVVITAPDEIVVNGKSVGATSLVVWLDDTPKSHGGQR